MSSIQKTFLAAAAKIGRRPQRSVERRRCEDQFVGWLGANGYQGLSEEQRRRRPGPPPFSEREPLPANVGSARPIILVLESPHKDEFPAAADPRPANGATGWNIITFSEKLASFLDFREHPVRPLFIVNAIQYQCSLGDIKAYRDSIFHYMWGKDEVRKDLLSRIRRYSAGGDFSLINACTAGRKREKLRQLVHNHIGDASTNYKAITHPSSWVYFRGPNPVKLDS